MEWTIWLLGVCQGWHPFHRLSDWGDNAFVHHILQELLNDFSTFNRDLTSCMLYWGTEGSRQIVYTPGILPVVSNDWGNAFLRETMSHTYFMVTIWSCNELLFSMGWDVGSCNELFSMHWDVTLGTWSCNVLFPMGNGVTLVTWSCVALFPMGSGNVLGAWSCNVLWWFWNGLFWCCLCFRSDFFGDVAVGVFLTGLLEYNGLLNETCLLFGVLVAELTIACVFASLGTLNSTMPRWMQVG